MKNCTSGRIITKSSKKGNYYYIRLNFVDNSLSDTLKYSTKDIPTHLEATKRNQSKANAMVEPAIIEHSTDAYRMYYHVYCQKWLDSKRPTLEATSFEGYQYRINIIKKYFSENPILVTAIKPRHIKEFFDYLLVTERTVGKKTVQGYSNRTIKDVAMLVRATLAEAVKLEIIAKNPAISIKTPKRPTEHTQRAYIGIDELSTFMQAISGHRLELPFTLALYYGLRREEILGLRWSSIRNDKIYIEHTVSRVNTTVAKNRTKTDASYREYPLTDAIRDKLEQIRDKQNYCRQMFGEKYCRSDYIFTWEDGRPYSPDYLTKSFKKLVLANETLDSTLTLHSLRASCVSLLIHSGVDIKDV